MKFFESLKTGKTPNAGLYHAPPGKRLYAIGDVHGCLDHLIGLMTLMKAHEANLPTAQTYIVFLGDLIDRGPDSAGVLDWVTKFSTDSEGCFTLLGNHEEMFLKALAGDHEALVPWLEYGGDETLRSYGVSNDILFSGDPYQITIAMQKRVPKAHKVFLESCLDSIDFGDYMLAHAGVDPKKALDAQDRRSLLWIREPFLSHAKPLAKMIVHGHTIEESVKRYPHRIAVDTGAYNGGTLSAVCLEGDTVTAIAWPETAKI